MLLSCGVGRISCGLCQFSCGVGRFSCGCATFCCGYGQFCCGQPISTPLTPIPANKKAAAERSTAAAAAQTRCAAVRQIALHAEKPHDSPASVKCRTSNLESGVPNASAIIPFGRSLRSPCPSFCLLMIIAPLSSLPVEEQEILN